MTTTRKPTLRERPAPEVRAAAAKIMLGSRFTKLPSPLDKEGRDLVCRYGYHAETLRPMPKALAAKIIAFAAAL